MNRYDNCKKLNELIRLFNDIFVKYKVVYSIN